MMSFNVLTATVTDIEEVLNNGTLTSEIVVTEYLKQIDRHNGYLHAVIAIAPKQLLIERARFLDQERAAGRVLSPLHGIPLLIKDNIATHPDLGIDTTAGTLVLVGSRVRESASCVSQRFAMSTGWLAVGGLTQSTLCHRRQTLGRWFRGHSAVGGSSSGSCPGVAAGFAPVALGTDTNGSILTPATRHDVYAMKSTLGLISQDGICPISFDFDSAGPIARSARGIAILMDVIVDHWHMPTVAVAPNKEVDDQRDEDIKAAYEKSKSLGAVVKQVLITSLDELVVDGMSQLQRVMGEFN
ncbi:Amidase signature domain protein [Cordyceps fumosorosea ARSEF 2679]|uniref:Amidase signature domain protein n=1 Tax=Cordyceps fumosorosea (strain ARSEF 2679) TaxID=1081104 RepID=A0A162HSB6_CORFA|nr:Amidase signature domain protein [Cordyceps fumosorosea ARSEF 2679]OAA42545.1 Amidase signature domain protein [Cordyceps fumosorosea ARSEF 2679]